MLSKRGPNKHILTLSLVYVYSSNGLLVKSSLV
nr:MAG TPA: hypothetical protein [Caudoviricetes sp.]